MAAIGLEQGGETHALGVQLTNIYGAVLPNIYGGWQQQEGHGPSFRKVTGRIILHPRRMNASSPHASSTRHILLFGTQRNKTYNFLKFVLV